MFIGGFHAAALCGPALGPIVDLDFINNWAAAQSRLTVSRASGATYFDATGTLQTAPSNVGRIDYDPATLACRGLLVEEQRTNSIRNPRCEGAVAGTPGTAPTYLGSNTNLQAGLSRTITASISESNISCFDLRVFGNPTVTGVCWLSLESPVTTSASQTWALSVFLRLLNGSLSNISSFGIQQNFAGSNQPAQACAPSSAALASQRYPLIATAGSGTSGTTPYLIFSVTSDAAIDFTLRIGGPQLELGTFATSLILPPVGSPAATTRVGETDAATLPDAGSYDVLVQDGAGAEWRTVSGPTLPVTPRAGQVYIKRVRAYRTGVISPSQKTSMAVAI